MFMEEKSAQRAIAYEFIREYVDTVPQLEALLLLWNSRPLPWTIADVAERLYVNEETARDVLHDLCKRGFLACLEERYVYVSASEEQNRILDAVDDTYRRELVPVSSMIHSKASRAVRDFARAFRLTKDRDKEPEK